MAERFRNFYIDFVPRQQNAHADALASLAASLAPPAEATEKVLVYSHDLYCPKFALEDNQTPTGDLQVKEALQTSADSELRGWRFSYIDTHCTTYCPMTLKRQLPLKEKLLDSTTTRSREHCIIDHMMECLLYKKA